MQRYFIHDDVDIIDGNNIKMQDKANIHHIKNVMRMNVNDKVYCVFPNKTAFICRLINIEDDVIDLIQFEAEAITRELPLEVTIVQGLPKKDKLEYIVQKGTELGASDFIVFQGDRSVAKWDEKKQSNKLKRLNKIVEEASEQSHRTVIPTIQFQSLQTLIEESNQFDLLLVAYEVEAKQLNYNRLSKYLNQDLNLKKICIVIGPEGGLSEQEISQLFEHGFHSVRLGPRILRTETAATYALSAISYEFEDKA